MQLTFGIYKVRFDGQSFVLTKTRVIEAQVPGGRGKAPKPENVGAERDTVLGYYPRLTLALESLCDRHIGGEDIGDAMQLSERLNESLARVEQYAQRICLEKTTDEGSTGGTDEPN